MKKLLVILVFSLWACIFLSDSASARYWVRGGVVAVRRVIVVRPPILPGPAIVAGAAAGIVAVGVRPYPPYWRSMYCPPASMPFYQPYGDYGYG
jgi:hypothetical protein